MIPLYDLAILSLASGRVAYSITSDEIFRPVRELVYRYSAPRHDQDEDGHPYRMIEWFKSTKQERERFPAIGVWQREHIDPTYTGRDVGFFGSLLECFYCFSFYTSVAAIVAYWIFGEEAVTVALPFAVWALANLYAKVLS